MDKFSVMNDFHDLLRQHSEADFVCQGNYELPVLQGTVATTYKTAALLLAAAATPRRAKIYEIEFGQTGSLNSTDVQCQWDLSRFSATAVLTATAVVPNLLDLADAACNTLGFNNNTAELTYTTAGAGLALKNWAINQRGSYRWRALDNGDNIIMPATSNSGVGLRVLSSGFTSSAVGNVSFVE
jgi:hypothetical protein